jgi:hypothetical protein
MDCEGSRGFAICLRACDLIRESERMILIHDERLGRSLDSLRNQAFTLKTPATGSMSVTAILGQEPDSLGLANRAPGIDELSPTCCTEL